MCEREREWKGGRADERAQRARAEKMNTPERTKRKGKKNKDTHSLLRSPVGCEPRPTEKQRSQPPDVLASDRIAQRPTHPRAHPTDSQKAVSRADSVQLQLYLATAVGAVVYGRRAVVYSLLNCALEKSGMSCDACARVTEKRNPAASALWS